MKRRAFLIHWDTQAAERYAQELTEQGWEVVVESQDGGRAYTKIQKSPPEVVIIDLSVQPSHGIEVGASLREVKKTRSLPILFVGGNPADRERTRRRVGDAKFVRGLASVPLAGFVPST